MKRTKPQKICSTHHCHHFQYAMNVTFAILIFGEFFIANRIGHIYFEKFERILIFNGLRTRTMNNNDLYRREFWIWVDTHSAPLHHCCAFVPLWCPAKWCKQKNGRIRKGKANVELEHTYTIHRITQCTDHKHEQLQSNRIHFKSLTKVRTSQKKTVAFLRGDGTFIAASPVMRWQKSAISSDENEQVNCILHKSNLYNLRRNINVIHCDAGNATHYFVIDLASSFSIRWGHCKCDALAAIRSLSRCFRFCPMMWKVSFD